MSQYPIPDFRISLLSIWEYFNEPTMDLHTPERTCAPSINVNVSRPYKTNTVDVVGGPTSSVGYTRRCSSAPRTASSRYTQPMVGVISLKAVVSAYTGLTAAVRILLLVACQTYVF